MLRTLPCTRCAHIHFDKIHTPEFRGYTCAAFPAGIPKEIRTGENRHTTPFPGDNGIQFEMASEEELKRRFGR